LRPLRAQPFLRTVERRLLNRPEVMITQAATKFDAKGKLTNQPARDAIAALVAAFKAWILRMRAAV